MMSGLDRTALLHKEAHEGAEEARDRARCLSRELAEFKEVHSATIDSLKSESDCLRDQVAEQKLAAEAARAEAKTAYEELEAYQRAEVEK